MSNEELVTVIQAGERDRLLELWERVRRFVWQMAARRIRALDGRCGITTEDLVQTGFLAMMSAAATFDPTAGAFTTWLSLHLKREFAAACGCRTRKQAYDPLQWAGSLDAPLDDSPDGGTLLDTLADSSGLGSMKATEERIYRRQLREAVRLALEKLPAEQRAVLECRYYDGQTIAETAERGGISTADARRLERRGTNAMRSDRQLRAFIEWNTPYYAHVGLRQFNTTRTSSVERAALYREALEERYAPLLKKERMA